MITRAAKMAVEGLVEVGMREVPEAVVVVDKAVVGEEVTGRGEEMT